jgi:hypothetical protein
LTAERFFGVATSLLTSTTGVGLGRAEMDLKDAGLEVTSVFLLLLEHPSSATAKITATAADRTVVSEMPTPNVRRSTLATLLVHSELGDLEFAI